MSLAICDMEVAVSCPDTPELAAIQGGAHARDNAQTACEKESQ